MTTSNNISIFGIHSDAERYTWAAYCLFVLLSSLIGDTLILYASTHNVFKLNKFIVKVIQHIAVCDLVYAVTAVFPAATSLIANSWVLGDALCYGRVYTSYYIYTVGMALIAVLTTTKLLLLKYPVRCAQWTKRLGHRTCSLIYIIPLTIPAAFLIVDKNDISFDYTAYNCQHKYKADVWRKIMPIIGVITLFLPNIVILVTTIPTLKYLATAWESARRVRGSFPLQGTLTVALTATIYCIATLPVFVFYITKENPEPSLSRIQFRRIANFMSMINIMSNFYIYSLTIKSFRDFLTSRISSILSACLRIMTTSDEGDQERRGADRSITQINETSV
ncbi:galanin receptor 2a-like [Bolinopsis microptera]|uniref:galanin receptor 2a-like n=1 Tax=Bolinopsis microptera TaxID=2820187 RepID=UPI003078E4B9